ncbi:MULTISPECIES: ArsR/SmtB family transcription factor [Henriciella]|uniref:Transcriptional regulator n=1 Tax=Henriciella pelagia TaxID=1977912 RepID=A0ABQ1JJ87_9PROT|nr:metalloregulator ArsR/SmtB family transcription factor [Henriciella pelagia]GGB67700.1 transcriptional regulator [Henriciella pelagia]
MNQLTDIRSIFGLENKTERVGEVADLLRAMASESRLKILCLLSEGELSVTSLSEQTDQTASSVSQHLTKLRAVGLVDSRRDAQTIYYRAREGIGTELMDVLCRHFMPVGD